MRTGLELVSMKRLGALAAALLLALAGCDSTTRGVDAGPDQPRLLRGADAAPARPDRRIHIAAVGDMNGVRTTDPSSASGKNGAAIAAALRAGTVDAFLGLGDFQYDTARCADYVNYWDTLWAGTKSRLFWISAPNHDWQPGRNEDLDNFMNGQCPGDTTKSAANQRRGWIDNGAPYSFNLGHWHFAMLSSALWRYDPARAARVTRWLARNLAAARKRGKHLAVAYHDPYFTSDTAEHSSAVEVKPWVKVIDRYDVRLTLSGSQHNYERSCPVRADGTCTARTGTGTTAFQVSTGGIGLRAFTSSPSYIRQRFSDTFGWLKLTLKANGGFTWRFRPVSGPGTDSGRRPPAR
jgi:hypothetical protein